MGPKPGFPDCGGWSPGLGGPQHQGLGNRRLLSFEVCSSPCSVQEELQRQMQETQQRCHQSTFVFDEAEKLHPGLLELLEPYLEPRSPEAHGAEAPRAIFLFLR